MSKIDEYNDFIKDVSRRAFTSLHILATMNCARHRCSDCPFYNGFNCIDDVAIYEVQRAVDKLVIPTDKVDNNK